MRHPFPLYLACTLSVVGCAAAPDTSEGLEQTSHEESDIGHLQQASHLPLTPPECVEMPPDAFVTAGTYTCSGGFCFDQFYGANVSRFVHPAPCTPAAVVHVSNVADKVFIPTSFPTGRPTTREACEAVISKGAAWGTANGKRWESLGPDWWDLGHWNEEFFFCEFLPLTGHGARPHITTPHRYKAVRVVAGAFNGGPPLSVTAGVTISPF